LVRIKHENPDYFCKPVPPFGDAGPKLLIVGLAPGMHGANRTGRPFTGDYAGILLYESLHAAGLATAPVSKGRFDGLQLKGTRISNAVKCLPPDNKPLPAEIKTCNRYLAAELAELDSVKAILALGTVAHDAVLIALGLKRSFAKFGHGSEHGLPGERYLVDSYHCSRYNTNTRRLTTEMFQQVLGRAKALAGIQ
jgi:uracil-DNA glycosylase family 4